MTSRATNIGAWCLALSLVLSTCVVAAGTGTTGAYFSDSKSGEMTGTYALPDPPSPTVPYRLEAGGSKQLHWGPGDSGPASGDTIAQVDAAGAIVLDFGEAPAGHGNTRPDVVRLVSLVEGSRAVVLSVSGPISDFVTEVRLRGGIPDLISGGDTRSVQVQLRIPDDAVAGTYTGVLVIHVQGWDADAHIPMTIVVCDKDPLNGSARETEQLSVDATATIIAGDPVVPEIPVSPEIPVDTTPPPASSEETDTLPGTEPTATLIPTSTAGVPSE